MATIDIAEHSNLTDERIGEIAFNSFQRPADEYTVMYNLFRSYRGTERAAQVGNVPTFPDRTDGSPVTFYKVASGLPVSVTHTQKAFGMRVTRETEEDDISGVINQFPELFGDAAKETVELDAAVPYNGAFDTYTVGDSQYLCSTSHTSLQSEGGTRSNRMATDSDLSWTTLWTAIQQMEAQTDHAGNMLGLTPDLLVIPPELESDADQILGSTGEPDATNNNVNSLRRRNLKVFVWRRLTDADAWFIVDSKAMKKLCRWYWRRLLDYSYGADFGTQDAMYQWTMRYSYLITSWEYIVGTPGAS